VLDTDEIDAMRSDGPEHAIALGNIFEPDVISWLNLEANYQASLARTIDFGK